VSRIFVLKIKLYCIAADRHCTNSSCMHAAPTHRIEVKIAWQILNLIVVLCKVLIVVIVLHNILEPSLFQ